MSRLLHRDTVPPVPAAELTARSADGSRIHVELHGPEDAPAVVLAHGWTCNTRFWDAQIRDLAADHRVIAYDQRGHGLTPSRAPAATARTRWPTTSKRSSPRRSPRAAGRCSPGTPWAG